MLDDFYIRSMLAGVFVALLAAPFGCFVIWRRMAYFGDTMAHSALLGITIALFFEIHVNAGVFIIAVITALSMVYLQKRSDLPTDTLLGILSHSSLALGLLAIGFMSNSNIDILSYLYGDVLSVGRQDIIIIAATTVAALIVLAIIWKPLLASTVNEDLAVAEGARPHHVQLIYLLLLAAVIAVTVRIIGVLLITALLVIPAATARRFAKNPETMAVLAAIFGAIAVVIGLAASLQWDTAAGPSIVAATLLLFLASSALPRYDISHAVVPHSVRAP